MSTRRVHSHAHAAKQPVASLALHAVMYNVFPRHFGTEYTSQRNPKTKNKWMPENIFSFTYIG